MPTVLFPRQLRTYTCGDVQYSSKSTNLKALVDEVLNKYPKLVGPVVLPDGRLQPFVGLFVSGHRASIEDAASLSLREDSEVALVSAVAGG
jgi:molybdopterin converting factor small subunit